MRIQFEGESGPLNLRVEKQDGALRVTLPYGSERSVRAERIPGDIILLEFDETILRIPFARTEDGIEFSYMGAVYSFTPSTPSTPDRSKAKHSSGELQAPMVGTVTGVLVRDGEQVKSYQPILVIEAMKVLATLEAPFAGTVSLRVGEGQQIKHGQVLAEVIPSGEAEGSESS